MPLKLLSTLLILVASPLSGALAQGEPDQEPEAPAAGPAKAVLGERLPELVAADWGNTETRPTLDRLRERIVVLFFFRTDDTSVDAFPILSQVHKNFSQRGVVVIGLTPQSKEAAENIIKGKELRFIVGYGVATEERYQVSAFPKVYLLDTAGRLVDRFHPGDGLEEKISAQIRRTPPAGSDVATLKSRYEQARGAYTKGEYGRAYALAQDVKKVADENSNIGRAVAELLKQIEEAARKWLDEAREAAGANEHDKACRILAELSVCFAGTQVAADADTEIGRLMGMRELKPKLRKALDNAKGQFLNDQAAAHEAGNRFLEALQLYREVTEEYPETDAAKAAEQAIERINSDDRIQQKITALWAEEEADRWLDIAERFAKVEMYDKAREFYQRILDTHPKAAAATRAKERLAKLPTGENK